MANMYLIRGIPGSGKSTLAKDLGFTTCEADQFFMVDGVYQFDPSKLMDAHMQCQNNARELVQAGKNCIVSNTFSMRWEMQPYIEMAKQYGARLTVVDVFDGGCTDEELANRNVHGVPLAVIKAMRNRWEHDWKNGSPTR